MQICGKTARTSKQYFCRKTLKKIDVRAFNNVPQIEKIYLQENQIRSIGSKAFRNLISLTFLQFDDNKIEEIHRDVFVSNFMLENLYLASNLIGELHPDLFRSLVYLKFLDLSNNRLKVLYTSLFKNLVSLNYLYLRSSQISAVQKGCFNKTLAYFYFIDNDCIELKLNGLSVKEVDEKLEICYENNTQQNLNTLKCEFGNFGCTISDAEVLITKSSTLYIFSTDFVSNSYNDDEVKSLVILKSNFDFVPSKFCETFMNLESLKASKIELYIFELKPLNSALSQA